MNPPTPRDVIEEEPTVEDIHGQAERNHLLLELPHIRCGCTKTARLSRLHFGKTQQRRAQGRRHGLKPELTPAGGGHPHCP